MIDKLKGKSYLFVVVISLLIWVFIGLVFYYWDTIWDYIILGERNVPMDEILQEQMNNDEFWKNR